MKTTLAAALALTVAVAVSPAAAQTNAPAAPMSFVDKQTTAEVLGTDFINTPVMSKGGQQIGKISNLVFDQEGRIELAVIGVGGFLGIGEKEVAVPFDSVKSEMVNGKHVFTVDASKDQLKAAPSYKTLNDQALNQRMTEWRAKAQQSWADVKARAAKAYEEAKQRVEEAREPKPAQ
ncbi:MAG: PRC-barrel domain-containing protein [Rhodomicrobium sp.]